MRFPGAEYEKRGNEILTLQEWLAQSFPCDDIGLTSANGPTL